MDYRRVDERISLEGVTTEGIPQRRGIAILVAHSLVEKGISLWHPLEAVGNELPRGSIYHNTELANLKVKSESGSSWARCVALCSRIVQYTAESVAPYRALPLPLLDGSSRSRDRWQSNRKEVHQKHSITPPFFTLTKSAERVIQY